MSCKTNAPTAPNKPAKSIKNRHKRTDKWLQDARIWNRTSSSCWDKTWSSRLNNFQSNTAVVHILRLAKAPFLVNVHHKFLPTQISLKNKMNIWTVSTKLSKCHLLYRRSNQLIQGHSTGRSVQWKCCSQLKTSLLDNRVFNSLVIVFQNKSVIYKITNGNMSQLKIGTPKNKSWSLRHQMMANQAKHQTQLSASLSLLLWTKSRPRTKSAETKDSSTQQKKTKMALTQRWVFNAWAGSQTITASSWSWRTPRGDHA